eukprot:TRINITY_DN4806_c0_g1_i1.p1 TRINITY_DN4806_c0_g1~~TRINITY_DN4806_c0_g1_i1.p1  ORF type:complete len:388 (-),score=68.48 TRINITY_DN4806_c0_g1_i1:24-1187(-)
MNGFVQNAIAHHHTTYNPMSMFNITTAPIINTLTLEFGVFDKWFCSVPGPTDPNRAFAMSATSNGVTHNFDGDLWTQQSIFDFLSDYSVPWRAYYQDDPWALMYFKDMHEKKNAEHVFNFDSFETDIKNGILESFTWIQPRMHPRFGPVTWQHPDSSVLEGERFYKSIYETLRNSKFWNELAIILTYDEHGGFYDHVTPPQTGIPSPDGKIDPETGFQFDRLGIRVPTVIISPWIPKGTVIHEPGNIFSGGTQSNLRLADETSQYDATSVIATIRKVFGITESLSDRDAWAGEFTGVFAPEGSEGFPREDCPTKLPDLPPADLKAWFRQLKAPLNDHLKIQVEFYCKFNNLGKDCGKDIHTQYEAGLFVEKQVPIFLDSFRSFHIIN